MWCKLEEVKLVNLASLAEQVMVAFKDAFQFIIANKMMRLYCQLTKKILEDSSFTWLSSQTVKVKGSTQSR